MLTGVIAWWFIKKMENHDNSNQKRGEQKDLFIPTNLD